MAHPFELWSQQTSARLFLEFLVLTLVFSVCPLGMLNQCLINPKTASQGMVSFETAFTQAKIETIVDSWDDTARNCAFTSLLLDYAFIILYAATLSFACLMAARFFGSPARQWTAMSRFAVWLAWGQLVAGILDAAENVFLLYILRRANAALPLVQPWPALAGACASVKFLLIGVGLCCILTAVIFSLAAPDGSE